MQSVSWMIIYIDILLSCYIFLANKRQFRMFRHKLRVRRRANISDSGHIWEGISIERWIYVFYNNYNNVINNLHLIIHGAKKVNNLINMNLGVACIIVCTHVNSMRIFVCQRYELFRWSFTRDVGLHDLAVGGEALSPEMRQREEIRRETNAVP